MTVVSMAEAVQHFSFFVAGPTGQRSEISPEPVVSICLQRWRQSGSGMPIIGTYLKTERDIDLQVDAFIANLEAVRIAAKRTLQTVARRSFPHTDRMKAAAD
jgi:hypothetical protein